MKIQTKAKRKVKGKIKDIIPNLKSHNRYRLKKRVLTSRE